MQDQFPKPHVAKALLPHAFDLRNGAHDEAHLLRVWRNVERIASEEGGDIEILLAQMILHRDQPRRLVATTEGRY